MSRALTVSDVTQLAQVADVLPEIQPPIGVKVGAIYPPATEATSTAVMLLAR